MSAIEVKDLMIEKLVVAVERAFEETDWCPACDGHSHTESCPVFLWRNPAAPKTKPQNEEEPDEQID